MWKIQETNEKKVKCFEQSLSLYESLIVFIQCLRSIDNMNKRLSYLKETADL